MEPFTNGRKHWKISTKTVPFGKHRGVHGSSHTAGCWCTTGALEPGSGGGGGTDKGNGTGGGVGGSSSSTGMGTEADSPEGALWGAGWCSEGWGGAWLWLWLCWRMFRHSPRQLRVAADVALRSRRSWSRQDRGPLVGRESMDWTRFFCWPSAWDITLEEGNATLKSVHAASTNSSNFWTTLRFYPVTLRWELWGEGRDEITFLNLPRPIKPLNYGLNLPLNLRFNFSNPAIECRSNL